MLRLCHVTPHLLFSLNVDRLSRPSLILFTHEFDHPGTHLAWLRFLAVRPTCPRLCDCQPIDFVQRKNNAYDISLAWGCCIFCWAALRAVNLVTYAVTIQILFNGLVVG
ncbi:hypothetical protein GMOD_00006286 [Pyrenophora seminiperda CCB06]|uniref:Uncharacterized protein n=1 Tax=Pyrenophora seminiperda CCB06 TaxID=1302712 RepID=A0A3M7M4P2_9PLEO|nr:hypothetical protein GMOD_00006286 [Pyrenophora seminiperda CCB06]